MDRRGSYLRELWAGAAGSAAAAGAGGAHFLIEIHDFIRKWSCGPVWELREVRDLREVQELWEHIYL